MSRETDAIGKLFFIQNKDGDKVPFAFNDAQQFLDKHDNPEGRSRILIGKCRQKGYSSAIMAKFSIRCLDLRRAHHAVVISHESEATQRLLDRVHYYLNNMNGPAPKFGRNSRGELYFQKTESTYYVGTAGSRTFGRGDWITDLHCSEYAWWNSPVKHTAGLFQAVPYSGRIYIETTGNGRNNDFYYMWQNADAMGYLRAFYAWHFDIEYELDLPKNKTTWKPDTPKHNAYLTSLQHKFKLSDRKMWWYEVKLREFREDLSLMQQEYPSEPEEMFQATGGAIFPDVTVTPTTFWIGTQEFGCYATKLTTHPQPTFHYVLGADPSGGTGHDAAAIIVICVETGEQTLALSNNRLNPLNFGRTLVEIGKLFNDAYITCEGNNHGAAVIPYLKENYPRDKLYKVKLATKSGPAKYGWYNTDTTKHALVGLMQEMFDQIALYDTETVMELKSFEETAEGKMEGKSDNLVIATGLAMLGFKRYEYLRRDYLRPAPIIVKEKPNYMTYTLDEILENINARRRKGYGPFQPQAGQGYPYA